MTQGRAHLSTWIKADEKQRFGALASHQSLSESALLRQLVRQLLRFNTPQEEVTDKPPPPVRDARLSVRLQADDHGLLRARAAAREMPAATYLAVLARSHLRSLAPLTDRELELLERSISELNALGRNLNVIARSAQQGRLQADVNQEDLWALLRVCEGLRDHIRSLVHANSLSWERGHAWP